MKIKSYAFYVEKVFKLKKIFKFFQQIIDIIRLKTLKKFLKKCRENNNIENIKRVIHTKNLQLNDKRKINIVFVCHRPAIFNYLKSIVLACIDDSDFNVVIVAIPNKKQLPDVGLNHEIYETEGAEEFFKDYPCKVINGYNYDTKEWFDLKSLKPDYLFFQTPYNICRPRQYSSEIVSQYTQLCYFHYGFPMLNKGEDVMSEFADIYFKYCYFIFAETDYHRQNYIRCVKKYSNIFDEKKVITTGQVAFDSIAEYKNSESPLWKDKEHIKFRILRSARWCIEESTFLDYADFLYNYCEENDCGYVFRPHPQLFLEFIAKGFLSEENISEMIEKYNKSKNCNLDTGKEYLSTIWSSDVLISDASGLMFEYLITGKPMIHTKKIDDDWLNDFAKTTILDASYTAKNCDELKNILDSLRKGIDPLKEKRQEIIKNYFHINPKGSGQMIKDIIKRDFYGN